MVHSFKKQTKQNKKELCVCDNTGQYCYFIRNSYQTSRSPSTAAKQWQEVLKLVYLFTRVLNETKDKKKKRHKIRICIFTPLSLQLKHSLFICQKGTSLLACLILRCSSYFLDVVSTFSSARSPFLND